MEQLRNRYSALRNAALRKILLFGAGLCFLCLPGLLRASDSLVFPDSLLLSCIAPPDTSLFCGDPAIDTPDLLGVPAVPAGSYALRALPVKREIQACGSGKLTRSWRLVRDPGTAQETLGPVCEQTVTILPQSQYMIRFPADTTVHCSDLNRVDTAFYRVLGCDALTVTYSDVRVSTPGENCFLVYRTIRVINWCEFDAQSRPILADRDADRDGRPGDEPLWLIVSPGGNAFLDRDSLPGNQIPNARGYWTSSLENPFLKSRGYWEYQQIIRIVDNVAPQLSIMSSAEVPGRRADCTGDVNLAINVGEACTPDELVFKVTWDRNSDGFTDGDISSSIVGAYPRYRFIHRMPVGAHTVKIELQDRCGNSTERMVSITVTDARTPAPRCINSLVVPLTPLAPGIDADGDGDTDPGAVTIWAKDLLSSSQLDDCSGPLRYSVHRAERIEARLERPSPQADHVVLTCDDRPTELLYVYAWDVAGNFDYCETYVLLQDAGNQLCPELGDGSVAGFVRNTRGIPVEGARILLEGDQPAQTLSNKDGAFLFQFLKENRDYSITASIDTNHRVGVTTYDIVMIMRHILGDEPFTSPYQYLAADVDMSGSITILDVIQIRKLVLSLDLELGTSPNFRFVPANLSFERPENILKTRFPEQVLIRNLSGRIVNAGLIAVKLGDVTGDALSGNTGPVIIVQEPPKSPE